jgi:nucleoid-associated protein YgaU
MQRDVKIGIAIGVLLIALIAIFWWMKSANEPTLVPPRPPISSDEDLSGPIEPVAPGQGIALPPGVESAGPEVSVPGPTGPGGVSTTAPAEPVPMPGPVEPVNPVTTRQTHTVVAGDTLSSLAKRYYGEERLWTKIRDANKDKLPNPNVLPVGATLVIPDVSASATSSAPTIKREQVHTVAAGETLSGIAKKYYGSEGKWRLIYNANKEKIPSPDRLQVGVVLVIPPEE